MSGGTLQAGTTNVFPSSSAVIMANTSGAVLNLNNFDQSIGSLAGGGTIGGNVKLGAATLTLGNNNLNSTYAGSLSGVGSLVKQGTGIFQLAGTNNSYTGTTTVNAGTLQAGAAYAFPSNSPFVLANAVVALDLNNFNQTITSLSGGASGGSVALGTGTLTLSGNTSTTFSGVISGAGGGLTKQGAGSLILAGTNTYTGTTTITSGTLTFTGNTSSLGGNIANSSILVFNQSVNSTFGQIISGAGLVFQNGSTNLTLSGANTYSGTTTISSGTLTFTGNTSGISGNIANGNVLVFNQTVDSTFGGIISGTGTVTKSGSTNFTLSGTNTYSGTTTISGGTLTLTGNTSNLTSNTVNSAALVFNQANNSTYGGIISGTGTLTKNGTTNISLSAANTYSGLTSINGGTLTFTGNTSGLGGNIANAGVLAFAQGSNSTYANIISGTGSVVQNGTANLTLSGPNTYTGTTTINSGTLTFSGDTTAVDGNIVNSSALVFNQGANSLFAGIISGGGSLSQTGSATLTLSGPNTYTGSTIVSGGILTAGNNAAFGVNSAVTVSGGSVLDVHGYNVSTGSLSGAGSVTLGNGSLTTGSGTFSGVISGTGSLTKNTAGTLSLSGSNTYLGTTTVSAGTLQAGANNTLSPNSPVLMTNTGGAVLSLNGFDETIPSLSGGGGSGGNVTLGTGTLTLAGNINTTYSGAISGTGGITISGTGTFQLAGANNTYQGTTTITKGTLQAGAINAFPLNSIVVLANSSGAALDLNNFNEQIGSLSGGGSSGGNVTLGTGILTIGGNNINAVYSGAVSGTGGLTIQGTGTFQLNGVNNSYLGTTTVNRGTLQAGGVNTFPGNSPFLMANAANAGLDLNSFNQSIISLAGGGSLGGNVTLGNGTLTVSNIATTVYSGAISGSGGLTKSGTGTFVLAGSNSYTGVTAVNQGTIQAGATNAFSPNSAVVMANIPHALLDLNNFNEAIGSLAGGGIVGPSISGGNVSLGTGVLTIGGDNTSTTYSGVISGTGGVTKVGSGTLNLQGLGNTYLGTTTINGGTIQAGVANVLSMASPVVIGNVSGATLDLNSFNQTISSLSGGGTNGGNVTLGTATLFLISNNINSTYSGSISGTGGLTIQGTGTFRLSGSNVYQGTTSISMGTLQAGAVNAFSPNSEVVLANSSAATMDLNGFNQTIAALAGGGTSGGNVTLGLGTLTLGGSNINTTYSGAISGTGGLTIEGTGTFRLLGTNNTYLGTTTVNGGRLQAGSVGAFSPNSTVSMGNASGAILDLNNYNQTIGNLSGGGSLGGNVTLGTATLTLGANNASSSYAGAISGTGGLVKLGTGTFQLAGTHNIYLGTTTVSAGVLQAGAINALPLNSTIFMANIAGAVLDLNGFDQTIGSLLGGGTAGGNVTLGTGTLTLGGNNADTSYAGAISGAGGLTKDGAGTFQLAGTHNTYFGTTTINGGTLQGGAMNALPLNSIVVMANVSGAALDLNNFDQTIGSLSGGGSSGGNVSLGNGTLTIGGGNIKTTYSGAISGTGGLIIQGTGTFQLAGINNVYLGTTTINRGTLQAGVIGALPSNSTILLANASNAGLDLNGFDQTIGSLLGGGSLGGNVALGTGTLTLGGNGANTSYAGAISGTGGLTKDGGGTFQLTGTNNTYHGTTSVNGGTLQAGVMNALPSNSTVVMANASGASLDLNNFDQTIGSLSGGGSAGGNVALGTGTLTLGGNNASTIYSGAITGTGGLIKEGAGTFQLAGTGNTYLGTTTVNHGTLQAGVANALPTNSTVLMANVVGGTLDLNGFDQTIGALTGGGSTGGNVTLGGGTLTLGGNNASTVYSGSISGPGGLVKVGAGIFQLAGTQNTYSGSTTISAGTLQAGANNAFPVNSDLFISNVLGAGLDLNGFNETIGSLSGGGVTGGNVTLGGGTLSLGGNNSSTTYSGAITGTGGVTKRGSGTFVLAGTGNSYSGLTSVTGGTLRAGANGAFSANSGVSMGNVSGAVLSLNNFNETIGSLSGGGSSGGNISLGSGILTLGGNNSNTTYSGAITGTGELIKVGSGTFQLAGGGNTYSGTTTISNGVLIFSGDTSGLGGNIVDNASLVFNQSSNSSLNGSISGVGSVTQNGSAVITLAGNNSYGGLTSINSGGLTFTGNTSGLTGNIVDNGALTFNQSSNSAFSGSISGGGTLTKNGAATLTLSGASSYSGMTTVAGGILRAGAGDVFSPNSPVVMDNTGGAILDLNGFNQTIASLSGGGGAGGNVSLGSGTLTTGNGSNTVYGGVISGGGGVTKVGTGKFSLTGINTFTGVLQILSGELNLNGSVGGNATVANGATLSGTGTVDGNLIVNAGGTISPGNSIGTFHVLGNYTNNGGNYFVEINGAGQSDLIDVGGTATINGGTVIVASVDGTYNLNDTYTIVTAGSVTGTYSTLVLTGVLVPLTLLNAELTYDPQHVYLNLKGGKANPISFVPATCNELAVANELKSALVAPTIDQTILLAEFLGLSQAQNQSALDSLTGQQHTDDLLSTSVVNRQFIRRLYDPVRPIITVDPCHCLGTNNAFGFWNEAGAGQTHLTGNGNAHGFDLDQYEVTFGMQDTFCSDWTLGLAASYEYDQFRYKHAGKGSSKTWLVGFYGLYRPSRYYTLLDIAYGDSANIVDRPIDVGSTHYRVRSKPKISQITCYGEVGVDFLLGRFLFQPFAGVEVGSYSRSRVVEQPVGSPGGWELVVNQRSRTNVFSRLGLHITTERLPYRFAVSLDLAWVKRLTCSDNAVNVRLVNFGGNFNINGVPLNSNSFDGAITISTHLCEQLRVYIEASGEAWNNAGTYNALGGAEFVW